MCKFFGFYGFAKLFFKKMAFNDKNRIIDAHMLSITCETVSLGQQGLVWISMVFMAYYGLAWVSMGYGLDKDLTISVGSLP